MNLVPFTNGARKKKACLMLAEMHLAFPLSLAEKTRAKLSRIKVQKTAWIFFLFTT